MTDTLAVVGAGSWGTALAIGLAPRFDAVQLWSHNEGRASEMQSCRQNARYLPGIALPPNVEVTHELAKALPEAGIVLMVVPSSHLRTVAISLHGYIKRDAIVVSATKGIENSTLLRMSEVLGETLNPASPVAVLSGPTFAKDIAAGEPAAVVIANQDSSVAATVQHAFATPNLRFYASTDVVGVELGAALKNVIAIGAGVCHGLGLGSNTVAALVTRGLAEISRLAVDLGGNPRTLSGLAGLGDLVLTATGDLSRNRRLGIDLGRGRALNEILAGMTMVAEGVETCRAAHALGEQRGVSLPIISNMYAVLYEGKDPRDAIRELMERPLTNE